MWRNRLGLPLAMEVSGGRLALPVCCKKLTGFTMMRIWSDDVPLDVPARPEAAGGDEATEEARKAAPKYARATEGEGGERQLGAGGYLKLLGSMMMGWRLNGVLPGVTTRFQATNGDETTEETR